MVDMFNIKNEKDWFELYKKSPERVQKFLREKFPQFYNKVKNTYETLNTLYDKGTTNLNDINKQVNNSTNRIKSGAQEFVGNIKQGAKETINKGVNAAKAKATEIGKAIPKSGLGKAAMAAKGIAKAAPIVGGGYEIYDAATNQDATPLQRAQRGVGGALMMIPFAPAQVGGMILSGVGNIPDKNKEADLDWEAWKNTYTYPDGSPRIDKLAPGLKPLTQEEKDRWVFNEAINYDNITDPQRRAYVDAEYPAARDRFLNSIANGSQDNNQQTESQEFPYQFTSYQTQPQGPTTNVNSQGNVINPINNQQALNGQQTASNEIQGNNTMNNNYNDVIQKYSELLAQQQAANDIYKQEQVDYYNQLLSQYKEASRWDNAQNAINQMKNSISRSNRDIQYIAPDGSLRTINTGDEPLNLPTNTTTNKDRVLEQAKLELAKQELNKPTNVDLDNYMKMLQMEEMGKQYGVSPAIFYGDYGNTNAKILGQQAIANTYGQNAINEALLKRQINTEAAAIEQQWNEKQKDIKLQNDIAILNYKYQLAKKEGEDKLKNQQDLETFKYNLSNNAKEQAVKLAGNPSYYPSIEEYNRAVNNIYTMITNGKGDNKELKNSWVE